MQHAGYYFLMHTKFLLENLEGTDHLRDHGINMRILAAI
jgi:hypothetical protein